MEENQSTFRTKLYRYFYLKVKKKKNLCIDWPPIYKVAISFTFKNFWSYIIWSSYGRICELLLFFVTLLFYLVQTFLIFSTLQLDYYLYHLLFYLLFKQILICWESKHALKAQNLTILYVRFYLLKYYLALNPYVCNSFYAHFLLPKLAQRYLKINLNWIYQKFYCILASSSLKTSFFINKFIRSPPPRNSITIYKYLSSFDIKRLFYLKATSHLDYPRIFFSW